MRYDVLLADADGTLFDFLAGERVALLSVLQDAGLPAEEETVALYSRINESHWKKLERGETTQERLRVERFVDFLEALGKEGDPQALSAAYIEQLGQQRILLPGARDLCKAVSERMPIYLVTNGIARVQRSRFEHCEIAPYISGLVISEEVGHAKPNPAMVKHAMELAGVCDGSRTVLLGDSITADIGAARNACVDSVLFTNEKEAPQGHGATYVARTLREAQTLILA